MKRGRLLTHTIIPGLTLLLVAAAMVVLARGPEALQTITEGNLPSTEAHLPSTEAHLPSTEAHLPSEEAQLSASEALSASDHSREVHLSVDGRYTFPAGVDPDLLEWTEYHWDDGNAVDIFADSGIPHDSPVLDGVHSAPVLAVTSGTAIRSDNPRGGIAVILQADNGTQFYYSHLSDSTIEERESVEQGQPIGRIGNTGTRTRFIEPHLHFEVVEQWHDTLSWPDTVNAARWIRRHFGLRWTDRDIPDYPETSPAGSPVFEEVQIEEDFSSMQSDDAQATGVVLRTDSGDPGSARSVLTGEVTVMRGTPLGLRVQITNRPADTTVVYSGLAGTPLRTGSVVSVGDTVGSFAETLHFMYFHDDEVTDPLEIEGWDPSKAQEF